MKKEETPRRKFVLPLAALGIDLTEFGEALKADGVRLFAEAYK
jgi:hypothetical protein